MRIVHIILGETEKKLPAKEMSLLAHRETVRSAARIFGVPEAELRMEKAEGGKPYFPDHPEVHFSISHSGHRILIALSDVPCGADVEQVKEMPEDRMLSIARRIMSGGEYAAFLRAEDRSGAFFTAWVMKEAESKLSGRGFAAGFKTLRGDAPHLAVNAGHGYKAAVFAAEPFKSSVTNIYLKGSFHE